MQKRTSIGQKNQLRNDGFRKADATKADLAPGKRNLDPSQELDPGVSIQVARLGVLVVTFAAGFVVVILLS